MITDRQQLRTYECDGLAHYRVTPGAGGAAPRRRRRCAGGRAGLRRRTACRSSPAARAPGCPAARCRTPTACSIVTSRMRAHPSRSHPSDQRAVVEPGVINLDVTRAAAAARLLLRARPVQPADLLDRRQRRGELRRRALPEVRLHHQPRHSALEVVTPDGDGRRARRRGARTPPGYDLLGAFVGSEGTLGIATEVTVRLIRAARGRCARCWPASRRTDEAGAATSAIIARRHRARPRSR